MKRVLVSHEECVVDVEVESHVTNDYRKLDVALQILNIDFASSLDWGRIQIRYLSLPRQAELCSQYVRGPPRC